MKCELEAKGMVVASGDISKQWSKVQSKSLIKFNKLFDVRLPSHITVNRTSQVFLFNRMYSDDVYTENGTFEIFVVVCVVAAVIYVCRTTAKELSTSVINGYPIESDFVPSLITAPVADRSDWLNERNVNELPSYDQTLIQERVQSLQENVHLDN